MLKLTVEQYDDAVGIMARELARCEQMLLRTNLSKALMMFEALGEKYDVTPKERTDLPLANDNTDALIESYWADTDPDDAFANALRKWTQGLIP